MNYEVVVIGGGIIGLATAWRVLVRRPHTKLVVIEKEDGLAKHQSGRNSGVLHSGIYYRPGTLKATNCRQGRKIMIEFCRKFRIPHEVCGKVIVATDDAQRDALERLRQRAKANGVPAELIDVNRLRELEPHVRGVAGLHVPDAGIVDFPAVCKRLARQIEKGGGEIRLNSRVEHIKPLEDSVIVATQDSALEVKLVINCAGLYSDRVARAAGMKPSVRIIPFRGEYYTLNYDKRELCRNLIYPVPDPRFPFLGVHLTRTIQGPIECGPNAVLAMAREGYRKRDVRARDVWETFTWPGFLRVAGRHCVSGGGELWRSLSKAAFTRQVRKLVPDVTAADLTPAPAGVRAQAVSRHGELIDDFHIDESASMIHVLSAPSPAATASLSIGKMVAQRVMARLGR
jgi:L-2-hydroxyglutarate oxidase